jgi:hypothetical protein
MSELDSFALNIAGVSDLISSGDNKVLHNGTLEEGVQGDEEDVLALDMSDEELIDLKEKWEIKSSPYIAKIKPRQERNRLYYAGKQKGGETISSNLIFEAEETFIPQALSKSPEPVVWSDNTDEGKSAANDIKTMLQYHADVLRLRSKLGVMVRHWSIFFLGAIKHGYDIDINDITLDIRKPQNFILDPDGYIDEYGNYKGNYLGEKIESTAKELIRLFPEAKGYVTLKVDGKLGTNIVRTEWWTDEYCFTTFQDIVLDKHKNPYFNYETKEAGHDEYGEPSDTVTPGRNHFARPKMPYTFLSVFSLQEQPHDITNLVEQSIPNQERINDRDEQISRNLRAGNNSIALSGKSFNSETARQAAQALEEGSPVLVPDGQVDNAIKRLPMNDIASGVFNALEIDKTTLRSIFGTAGLSNQQQTADTTARGMILNQSHDSTRIGGGIGDALEQVADNIFNWWLQLYFVFYDEAHYGAVMGGGKAVDYVRVINSDMDRNFVVSVSPNSMQPKDEITEQNLAIDLANKGWLDPINLFKKLNYPDPMETAKMVTIYKSDPVQYMQMFFPESAPQQVPPEMGGNPPDIGLEQPGTPPAGPTLPQPPASPGLEQVPLSSEAMPK